MQDSLKTAGLAAFIIAVLLLVSSFIGYRYGSSKWQQYMAEADKAAAVRLAELSESARTREQALKSSMDELNAKLRKEQADAKKTIDALRADVRSGDRRLSVVLTGEGGRSAFCDTPATEAGKTRAELDGAFADALVAIAAEGDDAIRELNACIDAYQQVQ